ncbi:PE family protein [Mycolicibacterium mengxianglii]|uniref:PE family protein n=1 Tax=Mycolicibacterium mengxianglii TaxID=2736649 RepID=UPI0018D1812C|nr:PE family protein [Mycolicibacterium mengxianglii]
MTLRVVPEGMAAASAAVEALAARLAAAHAAAAPAITAVIPAAADPVSLQTAVGFSAQGAEHQTVAAQGVEELGRSGAGVGESGSSYATGDAQAANSWAPVYLSRSGGL